MWIRLCFTGKHSFTVHIEFSIWYTVHSQSSYLRRNDRTVKNAFVVNIHIPYHTPIHWFHFYLTFIPQYFLPFYYISNNFTGLLYGRATASYSWYVLEKKRRNVQNLNTFWRGSKNFTCQHRHFSMVDDWKISLYNTNQPLT